MANGHDGSYRPQAPSQDVATKLMSKSPSGLRLGLQGLSPASLRRSFRSASGGSLPLTAKLLGPF